MREIKYRGKRIDNGEWVYGYYFIDERDIEDGIIWREVPQIQQRYGDHFNYFDVITETVGQFTGLHDKNGKEIYEGNIVRFNKNDVDLCEIRHGEYPVYNTETEECVDAAYGWYGKVLTTDALSKLEPFCYDRVINNQWIGVLEIEVIGNIYENPDLLKEATDAV